MESAAIIMLRNGRCGVDWLLLSNLWVLRALMCSSAHRAAVSDEVLMKAQAPSFGFLPAFFTRLTQAENAP